MEFKPDSISNRFSARMIEALEEVKERYSQRPSIDSLSIDTEPKGEESVFSDKIRNCKKLLGVGGAKSQSDTLIKIDELKIMINQISVDYSRRSFNKRYESSLENIKRTLEEIDGKGNNDILQSLEINDFWTNKNHERIRKGYAKLELLIVRRAWANLTKSEKNEKLRFFLDKLLENHKVQFFGALKTVSVKFCPNSKVKRFDSNIERILKMKEVESKYETFNHLKCINKFQVIVEAYHQKDNKLFNSQLRRFAVVYKLQKALNTIMVLGEISLERKVLNILKIYVNSSKSINLLIDKVNNAQRYAMRVGFTTLASYVESERKKEPSIKMNDHLEMNNSLKETIYTTSLPDNSRPKTFFSKKCHKIDDEETLRSKSSSGQNAEVIAEIVNEIPIDFRSKNQLEDKVKDTHHNFYLSDTLLSEYSQRDRNSPEALKKPQFPNFYERKYIQSKTERKKEERSTDIIVSSISEMQKNDSMSKIDTNSCLKESVPDSEFLKYCDMIVNSKKINYNFSFDNIDVNKGSQHRIDNEVDRCDSSYYNDTSPNLRDIDFLMQLAKKMNNSGEFKDQAFDFLKSVDFDNNQVSLRDLNIDQAMQKKESVGYFDGTDTQNTTDGQYTDRRNAQSDPNEVMDPFLNPNANNSPPTLPTTKFSENDKDHRELTAIKEESTIIDKSGITISKNTSNMLESRDFMNNMKNNCDGQSSAFQNCKFKNNSSEKHRRIKISPKNVCSNKDGPEINVILSNIANLKNDIKSELIENESYATSNSSDLDSSDSSRAEIFDKKNDFTEKGTEIVVRKTQPNCSSNKRLSLQTRFNVSLNPTNRPISRLSVPRKNIALEASKWNEHFKAGNFQYKPTLKPLKFQKELQGPNFKKKLNKMNIVSNPTVTRLQTDSRDPKLNHNIVKRTSKGSIVLPQPLVPSQAINFTSIKAVTVNSIKKIKTIDGEAQFGVKLTRGQSNYVKRSFPVSNSNIRPSSVIRTPAPVLKNIPKITEKNKKLKIVNLAKNFIEKNKKIAFENNVAKYFHKPSEKNPKKHDIARSFNISQSDCRSRSGLKRNFTYQHHLGSKLYRAQSVRSCKSQKSVFISSLVVNKENGSQFNLKIKRERNITQKFIKSGARASSVTSKQSQSHANALKQDNSRKMGYMAANKFFGLA